MTSIKNALVTVYVGYFFRYVYLIILIPFYSRVLGPDEYGRVLAAMSLYNFVWLLQNWGFSVTGARNIANAQTPDAKDKEFSRQLTGRFILLPLALTVGAVGTWWSPLLHEKPLFGVFATVAGILAGFNLGWLFQGAMLFRTSILAEIIGFAVSLPLILLMVKGPSDSIWVLGSLCIAGIIATTFAYWQARKTARFKKTPLTQGSGLIKESSPMFISAGANGMLANGGTYTLSLLSAPGQVALYGTSERVSTAILAMLGPAGQVMLSWFSRMAGNGTDQAVIQSRQKQAAMWVCGAGIMTGIGAATVLPPILVWFLGEKFAYVGTLMRVFSLIFPLAALNHALAVYFLLPARMDKHISKAGVTSSVLAIACMALVAGPWGAMGIAVTRVAAELVTSTMLLRAMRQLKKTT
jgi:O-antigen/teichoic acid export membrane protein